MGPNGSGKSTLAKVVAGHPDYQVTKGKVTVDGEDVLAMEADERARRDCFSRFNIERDSGRYDCDFLRAALQARLPEGRRTRSHRLLREALRKNGATRNGSFVHITRGE